MAMPASIMTETCLHTASCGMATHLHYHDAEVLEQQDVVNAASCNSALDCKLCLHVYVTCGSCEQVGWDVGQLQKDAATRAIKL